MDETRPGTTDTDQPDDARRRFVPAWDADDLARTSPQDEENSDATTPQDSVLLEHSVVGRYRVTGRIGVGGFGVVLSAFDEELHRLVAIKLPHHHWSSEIDFVQNYLNEARVLARLDHSNIVPVYDFGRITDGRPFVVSKFVEGNNLHELLRRGRLAFPVGAVIVAEIADALNYAHLQRVVHRDVKPANILIDAAGKAYLADFGIVLCEEDYGTGPTFAGTPAYMSPEQARSEGHRVDGRSDIFSLGVVFYQVLTSRRPFRADSDNNLLQQVIECDPRPPRQSDDSIPRDLERICLKAMSKRAADRYTTAKDMGDELRHWLSSERATPSGSSAEGIMGVPPPTPTSNICMPNVAGVLATPSDATLNRQLLLVVPKGLRSFDAHDADFFLELLPGPRDRSGLPDSIRFWKSRIEETEAERTFPVGLIYGPSGCGKSSLIKAGLLPHLSSDVVTLYVESTANETESRLFLGLRKRFKTLRDLDLVDTLAALRRGQDMPQGKKLLIVLDQFEQWLHGNKNDEDAELVRALRQCDGARVQCIVTVRDDFWLAVSRFLRHLEVRLVEGENSALADLFDVRHATKVLTAFGRAFHRIPMSSETPPASREFLTQAVAGLTEDGKIVPIRLALFAEIMKSKEWTPNSLRAMGGAAGVGVAFLEETFGATRAPPEHRIHQKAARAVLSALLPESGTDIKGAMRSRAVLLAASGYQNRPEDFGSLMRILDAELRLITPTDPEGGTGSDDSRLKTNAPDRYFQLTHDYLVTALRDWLTRKQKETPQGRAELLLADRAVVWNARPENRQLPNLWQWARIRRWTKPQNWTPPQRKMMVRAGRLHALRISLAAALVLVSVLVGWELVGRAQADALTAKLLLNSTKGAPATVAEMAPFRRWVNPLLREVLQQEGENDSERRLNASLGMLPVDPDQIDYVKSRLLKCEPRDFSAIQSMLFPYRQEIIPSLWAVLENDKSDSAAQLRAAAALANYHSNDSRWDAAGANAVALLVAQSGADITAWIDALQPVKKNLTIPLIGIFEDERHSDAARSMATVLFQAYAQDDADAWAELNRRLRKVPESVLSKDKSQLAAKTRANLGVALLQMNEIARAQHVLAQIADPTTRTYLIHKLTPSRIPTKSMQTQFIDPSLPAAARQALILAGGEFRPDSMPKVDRKNLLAALQQNCLRDRDSGVRAAAEWLLQQWGEGQRIGPINADLKAEDESVARSGVTPANGRNWFVNSANQVMVIIPTGQLVLEKQKDPRTLKVLHRFAISSKEVTLDLFREFRKEHQFNETKAPTGDCPALGVTWYEAAEFCNWLSKKDKIPEKEWCYRPNRDGKFAEGMEIVTNASELRGYRLPLDVEWEYACRAGSITDMYFGTDEELAGKYAWFSLNAKTRSHGVGLLKPNALGLFDMYGNAAEWCQTEQSNRKPAALADGAVALIFVRDVDPQSLRQSSFTRNLEMISSPSRNPALPLGTIQEAIGQFSYLGNCGFRVVRTLP